MPNMIIEALNNLESIYKLNESKQDQEKFKQWINQNLVDNNFSNNQEEINKKVDQLYNDFMNNKSSFKSPQNDIYYWMKLDDFDKFQDLLFDTNTKLAIKKRANEGARLVYKDKDWQVYEITSYEASKKYGANTKWCITGSKRWGNGEDGQKYWNDYYNTYHMTFYFFIRSNDKKYALVIYPNGKNCEIYNSEDIKVAFIPNAPQVDEIKNKYDINYSNNSDKNILINSILNGKLPLNILNLLVNNMFEDYGGTDIEIFDNVEDVCDFVNSLDTLPDFSVYCKDVNELYNEIKNSPSKYYIYIKYYDEDESLIRLNSFMDLIWTLGGAFGTNNWGEEEIEDFFSYEDETQGTRADIMAVMIANQLLYECKNGTINKNILRQLGCSQEYINSL